MNEDQIVELGIRSEALLDSKTFKFVIDYLATGYANSILQSDPNEADRREVGYYQHRALRDLVSQLAAFVQAKDDIVRHSGQNAEEGDE